jgi:hypothetical protein
VGHIESAQPTKVSYVAPEGAHCVHAGPLQVAQHAQLASIAQLITLEQHICRAQL